jgi:recombination protein RecA
MGKNDEALAIAQRINKEYGPSAVMIASEMIVPCRFTSGSLSLDVSLGGGWAGNQWSEIYGPENHGKTAITLKTLAANQQRDPDFLTLWVASEHYDLDQARALGVNTDQVHVLSTRDMAFAYDTVLEYLEQRAVDMVVLDSYPALIPPDEDEKAMDEYTMAEGAKMTNKFFRKVGKAGLRDASDSGDRPWTGIFINQPRDKPGAWAPRGQVAETTPGGRGKNFAFYTRLDVKRAEWIEVGPKSAKTKVGQVIRTNTFKNKGGPPHRVASLDFYFTEVPSLGFHRGDYDVAKDVLTMSVLFDVVKKGGSWYRFGDRQWQGIKDVLASVREEPDLLVSIERETREAAAKPEDKRTWTEEDVESATKSQTVVRRRNRKSDDSDTEQD